MSGCDRDQFLHHLSSFLPSPLDVVKLIAEYTLVKLECYERTLDTTLTSNRFFHYERSDSRGREWSITQMVCSTKNRLFYITEGSISNIYVVDLQTCKQCDFISYFHAQHCILLTNAHNDGVYAFITKHMYQCDWSLPPIDSVDIYNLENQEWHISFSIPDYRPEANKFLSMDADSVFIFNGVTNRYNKYNLLTGVLMQEMKDRNSLRHWYPPQVAWMASELYSLVAGDKIHVTAADNMETTRILALPRMDAASRRTYGPCIAVNEYFLLVNYRHNVLILRRREAYQQSLIISITCTV
jgi:hypothetical protein